MKLTPDDPRLTAYALDELDAADRAALEVELQQSPECRHAVEQIQFTAARLAAEFATEELPVLSPVQQHAIRNQFTPARTQSFSWARLLFYGGAAAAVILLIAMILPAKSVSMNKTRRLAHRSQPIVIANNPIARPNDLAPEVIVAVPSAATSSDVSGETSFFSASSQTTSAGQKPALSTLAAAPNGPPSPAPLLAETGLDANQLERYGDSLAHSPKNRADSELLVRVQVNAGLEAKTPLLAGRGFRLAEAKSAVSDQLRESLPEPEKYTIYEVRPRDGLELTTATYPKLVENPFLPVRQNPLSTFSIDVDTASYANVRRFLTAGQLPPHDAVRIEEMVNYFPYRYPQPKGSDPFSANIEVAGCPWNSGHRLVRVGLKGREIAPQKRPASSFVFLIDVSGSMEPPERLPLIKQALRQLVKKMTATDRVAIVVYASEAGIKLASTSCADKEKILEAIDALTAGGSTNGGDGIQQAYRVAQENFIPGGVNRVLLCTDGDFNVGITDQKQLVRMIQDKAKSGVFLTTLGVGTDNYKDALMQKLADKGNGNYAYLDTAEEAQKVLIEQMNGTLVTIAKDVKIQIEFNPVQVGAYRLIGYEKRLLRKEDFNNDAKDAGEIGAGHTVTAFYEIVPASGELPSAVDELKYQQPVSAAKPERYTSNGSSELLTLKLRYKQPDGDRSKLLEVAVTDSGASYGRASGDFKFAAAVASFGMLLRDSEHKGNANFANVLELAQEGKGSDELGYRSEFITLVKKAQSLTH